jgi:sigma-B regulation protein RsbU (phosphoserine phosphatase)
MCTNILVVDDEFDLQELIKVHFRKAISADELSFYFAMNGEEALAILHANPKISIIFTDINMPIMDGLTLLERLPELNRPYKAVVVSAYGDMSNIRRAMNLGAADFILKPFDFKDLDITMQRMIHEFDRLQAATLAEKQYNALKIELEIAKQIQESMLPIDFHPLPQAKLEIAACMIPADKVGGDFFDFFALDADKLAFVIADVSGKGISACLYMATTRALFRAFSTFSCAETLTTINHVLNQDNPSCMFVTAFYAILEINSGKLTYCSAGHPRPFLLKKDGSLIEIQCSHGHALGLDESPHLPLFHSETLILNHGDAILLYTDGVPEALDSHQKFYTLERLKRTITPIMSKPVKEIVNGIVSNLKEFTNQAVQSDDITILAFRRN